MDAILYEKIRQGLAPAVKSKQSGIVRSGTTTTYIDYLFSDNETYPRTFYIDITISEVNANKSILKVEYVNETFLKGIILNNNTIRVYVSNSNKTTSTKGNYGIFTWEVVEFY